MGFREKKVAISEVGKICPVPRSKNDQAWRELFARDMLSSKRLKNTIIKNILDQYFALLG
jgi:hypothetical protein